MEERAILVVDDYAVATECLRLALEERIQRARTACGCRKWTDLTLLVLAREQCPEVPFLMVTVEDVSTAVAGGLVGLA